ncbi:uncharacterized protein LOC143019422 [Oratosquilla oratoria]|uniref:uncharacterized protein LOC143019422 n=1 Tax=Oratosquilla oratoria TaxID=337810 RepID=UPI003F75D911
MTISTFLVNIGLLNILVVRLESEIWPLGHPFLASADGAARIQRGAWSAGVATTMTTSSLPLQAQPDTSSSSQELSQNGTVEEMGSSVSLSEGPCPRRGPSRPTTEATLDAGWMEGLRKLVETELSRKGLGILLLGSVDWVLRATALREILIAASPGGEDPGKRLGSLIPIGLRVLVVVGHGPRKQEYKADSGKACGGAVRQAALGPGGCHRLKTVACWDADSGTLRVLHPILTPVGDLKGATLTFAIVKGFMEVIPIRRRPVPVLVGWLGTLIHAFASSLNFRVAISERVGFGNLLANQSFDGVMGAVQHKEADMGLASLLITAERNAVVSFTHHTSTSCITFLTKTPRVIKDPFLLFQVYSWPVWLCILTFLIVSGIVLSLFWTSPAAVASSSSTTSSSSQLLPLKPSKDAQRRSLRDTITMVLMMAVYQGSKQEPRSTGGRTIQVSTWLVVMVVFFVYSGNLTAFLSIPKIQRPPESARELVQSGYRVLLSKGFSTYDILKKTPSKDLQYLFKTALITPPLKGLDVGQWRVDLLRYQDYALAISSEGQAHLINKFADRVKGYDSSLRVSSSNAICSLKTTAETLYPAVSGLALQKNSPLMGIINKKISWLRDMGVLGKLHAESFSVRCRARQLQGNQLSPLNIIQVQGNCMDQHASSTEYILRNLITSFPVLLRVIFFISVAPVTHPMVLSSLLSDCFILLCGISTMVSRGCRHPRHSFCYICSSKYIKKRNKKLSFETSVKVCEVYQRNFRMPVGDWNKPWAPHCCYEHLPPTPCEVQDKHFHEKEKIDAEDLAYLPGGAVCAQGVAALHRQLYHKFEGCPPPHWKQAPEAVPSPFSLPEWNMGAYSEEQGERFRQDVKEIERRNQAHYNEKIMGDYIWGLRDQDWLPPGHTVFPGLVLFEIRQVEDYGSGAPRFAFDLRPGRWVSGSERFPLSCSFLELQPEPEAEQLASRYSRHGGVNRPLRIVLKIGRDPFRFKSGFPIDKLSILYHLHGLRNPLIRIKRLRVELLNDNLRKRVGAVNLNKAVLRTKEYCRVAKAKWQQQQHASTTTAYKGWRTSSGGTYRDSKGNQYNGACVTPLEKVFQATVTLETVHSSPDERISNVFLSDKGCFDNLIDVVAGRKTQKVMERALSRGLSVAS